MAEDFGSILDGKANSLHSAYDVRNARAMSRKTGRHEREFLRGGSAGPGGGAYSPTALHEAGQSSAPKPTSSSLGGEGTTALSGSPRRARLRTAGPGPQAGAKQHLGGPEETLGGTLGLGATVGPFGRNATEDVKRVQSALSDEGHLDTVSGYPGTKMVEATKAFQKQNGLREDGQINPGGPTEQALATNAQARAGKRRRETPLRGLLTDGVGDTGSKLDQQVHAAKRAMAQGGKTTSEQVRNIERYRALKDKQAAAQAKAVAKANDAAAKARQASWNHVGSSTGLGNPRDFTAAQRLGHQRANMSTRKTRTHIGSYLDLISDPAVRPIGLTPANTRKIAWQKAKTKIQGDGHSVHSQKTSATGLSATQQLKSQAQGAAGYSLKGHIGNLAIASGIDPVRVQLAGDLGAVALAAVIAERHHRNDNRYKGHLANVMDTLSRQGHDKLVQDLTVFRADALTNKEWTPTTMTDEELDNAINTNKMIAFSLFEISVSGRGGPATVLAGTAVAVFADAVDKMEEERNRRTTGWVNDSP